jgi:hypothetical protein
MPAAPGTPSISYRQYNEILEERERDGALITAKQKIPDLLAKIQVSSYTYRKWQ